MYDKSVSPPPGRGGTLLGGGGATFAQEKGHLYDYRNYGRNAR